MFIPKDEIVNKLNTIKIFTKNESNPLPFKDFDNLIESTNSYTKLKIVLATSVSSEYELLIKKFLPNLNEIKNINDAKFGINIINCSVIRPYFSKKNNLLIAHREFYIDTFVENIKKSSPFRTKQDKSLMFERMIL
jgi:hypothetical protein